MRTIINKESLTNFNVLVANLSAEFKDIIKEKAVKHIGPLIQSILPNDVLSNEDQQDLSEILPKLKTYFIEPQGFAAPVIEIIASDEYIEQNGLPKYATPGSAGIDLRAWIKEPVTIKANTFYPINTGLKIFIKNPNIVGLLNSRSGGYFKHRLRVGQGSGTIDSDYTGDLTVLLENSGTKQVTIMPNDRIAQLLFCKVEQVELCRVNAFDTVTIRGEGGFGSTGVK